MPARLRISLIIFFLLLAVRVAFASTSCGRLKSGQDAWVAEKVNALVLAARASFESERATPAYKSVVNEIAKTLRQCKLSEDESFISRYRVFLEYVEALSLAQRPDHELGFIVPDKQYFEETKRYVQIPEFLLAPDFLKAVSRYETLNQAKAYLLQLNSKRGANDRLLFFSYRSRHLGTPDNRNNFGRLLIVVPGDAKTGVPEKWVQFGITDTGERVLVRNVSVVSAMLNGDGTNNTYFKDYYRTYGLDGSISVKGRFELGYG
nr:hypothetical protein [Acidobacteriota bacterium]